MLDVLKFVSVTTLPKKLVLFSCWGMIMQTAWGKDAAVVSGHQFGKQSMDRYLHKKREERIKNIAYNTLY